MKKPSGFIFYRGPSMLDGAPIVAIATGFGKASRNTKTGGDIIQTWILRDDMTPVQAIHRGADASVCGTCMHRGTIIKSGRRTRNVNRSCYVTIFQAPLVIYRTFKRRRYPTLSPEQGAELLTGRMVRLGAYGDPAAVPFHVWDTLLRHIAAKTGYTHQWRNPAFAPFAKFTMASCDTPEDFTQAKAQGWRTFRIRLPEEVLAPREIICPASKEADHKTTCDACKACGGTSAKAKADVAIIAHGAIGKVNAFVAARAA